MSNLSQAEIERVLRSIRPPLSPQRISRLSRALSTGDFRSLEDLHALTFNEARKEGKTMTTAKTNADEVTRLAEKVAVERGFKANDYEALKEATKIVLTRDKKLAKAYFADPFGKVSAADEEDEA